MRGAMFGGLVATTMAGCLGDGPVQCDTMAAASVNLTVVDENGEAVTDAHATFAVDGGAPSDCDAMPEGQFACGWEVAGDFALHVEAPGFAPWDGTAHVDDAECHVQAQSVTATLAAGTGSCTDMAFAAVTVGVTDSAGGALSGVAVSWGFSTTDGLPRDCEPPDAAGGDWICAWETTGTLDIYASADGMAAEMQEVAVPLDAAGCHPVTQHVAFTLDPQ